MQRYSTRDLFDSLVFISIGNLSRDETRTSDISLRTFWREMQTKQLRWLISQFNCRFAARSTSHTSWNFAKFGLRVRYRRGRPSKKSRATLLANQQPPAEDKGPCPLVPGLISSLLCFRCVMLRYTAPHPTAQVHVHSSAAR